VNGRVGVVCDRVAVGKKSCTSLINQLVELGRGIRDDRVDLVGSGNGALRNVPLHTRAMIKDNL